MKPAILCTSLESAEQASREFGRQRSTGAAGQWFLMNRETEGVSAAFVLW
jgi:hypothetical protein